MRKIFKSKKRVILLIITILLFSGSIWQAIMVKKETATYKAVGQMVDVGSYQAHTYTKGEGEIAFVFITGSGTPCAYTDFYFLQSELSKLGQTISFDHAGSGWSTNATNDRSIDNLVIELSALIDTLAGDKQVVLVCHSLGSLETIAYAQHSKERVKGIICLDAGSPEYYETLSELSSKVLNRSTALIRTIGINRAFGEVGFLLPLYGENTRYSKLPEEIRGVDKAMYNRLAGNSETLDNISLINENAAEVLKGEKLGKIPLLVLSAESNKEWEEVQKQLTNWSEDSKQITLTDSDHYIHWTNTEDVVKYMKEFVSDINE